MNQGPVMVKLLPPLGPKDSEEGAVTRTREESCLEKSCVLHLRVTDSLR